MEAPLFRIFYCTGWDEVVLHYRRVPPPPAASGHHHSNGNGHSSSNGHNNHNNNQHAQAHQGGKGPFHRMRMVGAPCRGHELGRWFTAALVPGAEGEGLEFYLTNGAGAGRAAGGGGWIVEWTARS